MDNQNLIIVEGPPEDVEPVTLQLQECVKDLLEKIAFKDISVDPKYYKHIIGKAGSNSKNLLFINLIFDAFGLEFVFTDLYNF